MTKRHPVSLHADYDSAHMKYLSDVATDDVALLMEKEKTYKGSWKKRGGVGAFMMLARKWDRLENILSDQVDKYDIFAGIDNDPSGDDGTVLAEVRDLRRYLLLVEAELTAQGHLSLRQVSEELLKPGNEELFKPGTPDDGGHHAREDE